MVDVSLEARRQPLLDQRTTESFRRSTPVVALVSTLKSMNQSAAVPVLDDQELASYRADGFVPVRGLFTPPEAAELHGES